MTNAHHRSLQATEILPSIGDRARIQRNSGCIVLKVPVNPDGLRMQTLLEAALHAVHDARARAMILDFAETILIDCDVAGRIENVACQAAVMNVPTILCELRPALCGALIAFGQHFPSIVKQGTLDQALDGGPCDKVLHHP